jgi:hypothetical protein
MGGPAGRRAGSSTAGWSGSESPTGGGTAWTPFRTAISSATRLLGEDTNGRDGRALTWQHQDRPLLAHLTVKAVRPGGTSPDTVLGLYHPDPVS